MDRKISDKKYRDKNKELLTEKYKQYANDNKDKISGYNKKYYDLNKDFINSKIECECGSTIYCRNKEKHFKTNKHINFN